MRIREAAVDCVRETEGTKVVKEGIVSGDKIMFISMPFDGAGVHSVPGSEAASAQILQGQNHYGDGSAFPSFDCYFDPTDGLDGTGHHSTNPGHVDHHTSTVEGRSNHAPVTSDNLKLSANLKPVPVFSERIVGAYLRGNPPALLDLH